MEKSREAFEAWNPAAPCDSAMIHPHSYRVNQRIPFEAGWQACDAHWREKLQSEEIAKIAASAIHAYFEELNKRPSFAQFDMGPEDGQRRQLARSQCAAAAAIAAISKEMEI
jgi:hypothetical protein